MPQSLYVVVDAPSRDSPALLQQLAKSREELADRGIELRLAIMQTRARLAELKAVLRQFDRYL